MLRATRELLETLVLASDIAVEDIASIMFTMRPDLQSTYPAQAARWLGWENTPLLGALETAVPAGLPQGIRVSMHVHTDGAPADSQHIHVHEAQTLRRDL